MPIVHGVNASPFVRKVRIALAEKNLDYELEPVMPFGMSDAFKKISPIGKIPVYQDGEFTLPDSSVICLYLEKTHPDPPLYPSDAKEYGRALFLEEYADTKLSETTGNVFFQRVVVAKVMKGTPDDALIERHLQELIPPVFDWLETQVGEGEGIVGGRFSIADLAIASMFVNFHHAGERVDPARWPALASYIERIHARPSIRKLIEEEEAAFSAAS